MPDITPFERVFQPPSPGQEGSIFGTIGAAMGNKSRMDIQQDAEAAALADLSQRVQQGATPQKAFMDFLQTPKGQDAFSRGVTVDLANKFMTAINPQPQVSSVGPGATPVVTRPGQPGVEYGAQTPTTEQGTARTIAPAVSVAPGTTLAQQPQGSYGYVPGEAAPTTEQSTARTIAPAVGVAPGSTLAQQPKGSYGYQPAYTNPTTEAQTFGFFKDLSGLKPEQTAKIAELQMLPPDQRDSETTRFFRDAVKNNSMDQGTADRLRTGFYQGAIKVIPKLNRFGETVGSTIVDMSDPAKLKSMDFMFQPGQPGQPGVTPPAPAGSPAAATQPDQPQHSNRATMFFGAGVPANILAPLGQVVRGTLGVNIPVPGSEEASANQRNLQALQTSLVQLAKDGSGLGVPIRVISAAQSMGPDSGMWSDPKTALAHAIDLHANIMDNLSADNRKLNDVQVSKSEKEAAEKRINSYEQILRQLPSMSEMTALQKDMAKGGPITRQNELSLGQVGRTLVGTGKQATQSLQGSAREAVGAPQPKQTPFQKLTNQELLATDPSKMDLNSAQAYRAELNRRLEASQMRSKK